VGWQLDDSYPLGTEEGSSLLRRRLPAVLRPSMERQRQVTRWDWRKGPPMSRLTILAPYFHAHDPESYRGACGYDSDWEVGPTHLIDTEEPNEGSLLCPRCLEIIIKERVS
jgi:hypothetical protein